MDSEYPQRMASERSFDGTPEPHQTTVTVPPDLTISTAALRGIEPQRAALARVIQEHNDQIVTFIERVGAAESRSDELAQQLRVFEREVAALRARVAERDSQLAVLLRHEQDAECEREELRARLAALKQSGERYRTEMQTLGQGYRARVGTIERERDEVRAQLAELTRRDAERERETVALRGQRDAAVREREFYRTYMEEFKAIAEACLEKMRAMRDYVHQQALAMPGDPSSLPSTFAVDGITLPVIGDTFRTATDERPITDIPSRP